MRHIEVNRRIEVKREMEVKVKVKRDIRLKNIFESKRGIDICRQISSLLFPSQVALNFRSSSLSEERATHEELP